MEKIIFYIIIGIIVAGYLVERILSWLNSRKISTKLPPELEDVYDSEQYSKQQQYKKDNEKLSYITSTLNTLLILAMIVFGGFAWLDVQVREFVDHPVWTALIFFGVLMFAADLIGMPFSVYDTFVIEEKYGFNKTTPRVFILDKLKGWMLSAIIGGGVFALIIWFYTVTREMFWIYAWIAVSFFMLFITMFYSTLIVPLFNKQTPLEEGELRNEIETFSKKAGFKLDNIFVIDGSKRSTMANAYFSGIGKKKRIV
ncbi:MAG: M48 family metallopeptidase, partial [Bacteroidales bacterium]